MLSRPVQALVTPAVAILSCTEHLLRRLYQLFFEVTA